MTTCSVKLSQYALIGVLFFGISPSASSINTEPGSPLQQQSHDHSNIIFTAEQFLTDAINTPQYSRVEIKMGHLDPRLRLTQCDIPLNAKLAPGSQLSGKTTVHVRCNSSKPWTVYLGAYIKLFANVIKTAEPLNRGHILQKKNLISAEEELSQLKYAYFTDMNRLIGKQLKRRLPQQKVIKVNYVKSPTLVKRGELVSIVTENAGYSVKMSGTAMMSGTKGDRIQVKNLSSKRIIEGTIKATGIVSIN